MSVPRIPNIERRGIKPPPPALPSLINNQACNNTARNAHNTEDGIVPVGRVGGSVAISDMGGEVERDDPVEERVGETDQTK